MGFEESLIGKVSVKKIKETTIVKKKHGICILVNNHAHAE